MPLFHRDSVSSSSRSSIEDPNTHTHHSKSGGLFGHRNSTSSAGGYGSSARGSRHNTTHGHGHSHGLFHRRAEDPAITAARDRVYRAEEAERAADKALYASRLAVRDARSNVKELERDAAEEARLAKDKQNASKDISKRARPLGRK
ncbi:hypothetical protein BDV06DRAFT_216309 [Aspergillus oleicola]